jgi:hypothetical protein
MVAAVAGQCAADPVHREGLREAQSTVCVRYLTLEEREKEIRRFEEEMRTCRQDPNCRPPGGFPIPNTRMPPGEYP